MFSVVFFAQRHILVFIILRNLSVVHIEDKIKILPIYQNRRKEELVIRMIFPPESIIRVMIMLTPAAKAAKSTAFPPEMIEVEEALVQDCTLMMMMMVMMRMMMMMGMRIMIVTMMRLLLV